MNQQNKTMDDTINILKNQNEILWKMNDNINETNERLIAIIIIMLIPYILSIGFIILSVIATILGFATGLQWIFQLFNVIL